ncbi:MAG: hypothetical protein ACLS9Y_14390 [Ruthenibacterium lactatiformans]
MKKGRLLANAYLVLVFGFLYAHRRAHRVQLQRKKPHRVHGLYFKWYQNLFHNDMVLKSLGVSGRGLCGGVHRHRGGTLAAIGISSMNKRAGAPSWPSAMCPSSTRRSSPASR